jgi:hypothetical protein
MAWNLALVSQRAWFDARWSGAYHTTGFAPGHLVATPRVSW